jgi:hypothetical protein
MTLSLVLMALGASAITLGIFSLAAWSAERNKS